MLTKIRKIKENILIVLVEWTKKPYANFFKKGRIPWMVNLSDLKKFPPNSLGNDLSIFFEKEGFDLMPYFESHDVFHVLLNYKTTVVGEVRMQFFLLGNKKRSVYAFFTAIAGSILMPEHFRSFIKELKKGKQYHSIYKWDFEHLLNESTESLRKLMCKENLQNVDLIF